VFGQSESAQVRTLLRLIEKQQETINNMADRLMYLVGQTWMPPPLQPGQTFEAEQEEPTFSAFHGLPPTEEEVGWDGAEADR
jgi:hypothetical protein